MMPHNWQPAAGYPHPGQMQPGWYGVRGESAPQLGMGHPPWTQGPVVRPPWPGGRPVWPAWGQEGQPPWAGEPLTGSPAYWPQPPVDLQPRAEPQGPAAGESGALNPAEPAREVVAPSTIQGPHPGSGGRPPEAQPPAAAEVVPPEAQPPAAAEVVPGPAPGGSLKTAPQAELVIPMGGGEAAGGGEHQPHGGPPTYQPARAESFQVWALRGISQRTQREHLELYRGYVRNTNEARQGLLTHPAREQADSNHSIHRQLRLGEIYNWSGVKNHEMFFSILSPTPRPPGGAILELINRDFGSLDRFIADFTAAAKVARGWAMLAYDLDDCRLHIFAGDRHDHAVWNTVILMGIDVFEHAYFIDHGTDRESYIRAFFENLDWEEVNQRLERYGLPR